MTAPTHLPPALKRLHHQLARRLIAFTQPWQDHAPLRDNHSKMAQLSVGANTSQGMDLESST